MNAKTKQYYPIVAIKDNNLPEIIYIEKKEVDREEFIHNFSEDDPSKYWQIFPFPSFIKFGQPMLAINDIIRVLKECKIIDEERYFQYHKGNPYYWLGFSYFLINNYEAAVYYMNAAVSEDLNWIPPNKPSPATDFIELKGQSEKQAAKDLVIYAEGKLKELIEKYNLFITYLGFAGGYLVSDFRRWFLTRAIDQPELNLQSLATTFISFLLEHKQKIIQLDLVGDSTSNDPFILHLFKGCLLLESLLKANPKEKQIQTRGTLGKYLHNLGKQLNIETDFRYKPTTLQDVINMVEEYNNTLDMAYEITLNFRNKAGHSLCWEINLGKEKYSKLFEIIGFCCLDTVFKLYNL